MKRGGVLCPFVFVGSNRAWGEWAHGIWFRVEWWSRPHYNGRPMHGCKKDLKGEPHSLITHHSSPPLPFHLAYFEALTTLSCRPCPPPL